MSAVLAAQNVFGPSTLVLVSLVLTVTLLAVRTYIYEARFEAARSALIWLDAVVVLLTALFFVVVYLRFKYLA